MNIFTGIEAEGPFQGRSTLFISGRVTVLPDLTLLLYTVEQVYLGADNSRGVTLPVLKQLTRMMQSCPTRLITIECDQIEQVALIVPHLAELKKQHVVSILFTIDTKENLSCMDQVTDIKFVNSQELLWHNIHQTYRTKLDDPLYEKDKEVSL